jgi:hypothetical protein
MVQLLIDKGNLLECFFELRPPIIYVTIHHHSRCR